MNLETIASLSALLLSSRRLTPASSNRQEEQLGDYKVELSSIASDRLSLETCDASLSTLEAKLSKHVFEISLQISRSLMQKPSEVATSADKGRAKLLSNI